MAGESPGARRHQQKRNGKREIPFHENRSANKYYKSKDVSVIGAQMGGDRKGRGKTPPKPNATKKMVSSDLVQSADRKYYGALPQAPTLQQIQAADRKKLGKGKAAQVAAVRGKRQARPPAVSGVSMRIEDKADIHDLMDQLPDLLDGNPYVIEVASKELLRRARAKLDIMVTSERLSEELARDVKISLAEDAEVAPKLDLSKPPEPTISAEADDDFIDDPLAVLSGEVDLGDDDGPSTEPVAATEIVDDDEPPVGHICPVGHPGAQGYVGEPGEEGPASTDDDDGPASAADFLDPATESPVDAEQPPVLDGEVDTDDDGPAAEAPMEDTAISVVAPQVAMEGQHEPVKKAGKKKKARRSGRGADE